MIVERADSSGIASLILTLLRRIIELVSVALCHHARGAIKMREIGALQPAPRSCAHKGGEAGDEDKKKQRLCPGNNSRLASCVATKHADAVYRTSTACATGGSRRRSPSDRNGLATVARRN